MTTYYFSMSGNNANDGLSSSSPKKDLSTSNGAQSTAFKAILATGGHTLLFKCGDDWSSNVDAWRFGANNGDYNTISSYGTGNKPILPRVALYIEAPAHKYIFDNVEIRYINTGNANCALITSRNIQFKNCIFNQYNSQSGTTSGYDGATCANTKNILFDNCIIYRGAQAGITLNNTHDSEIKNCTFIDCRVNSILVYRGASYNKIHHNTVTHLETTSGASIEINWNNSKSNRIYNNIISGNTAGMIVNGTNNYIYNNIFNNARLNLIFSGGNMSHGYDCYKNKIFNNTFYHNQSGVNIFLNDDLITSAYDNIICNNLFYKNNGYQNQIHYNVIDTDPLNCVTFKNNIYWTNKEDFKWYDGRIPDDFSGFDNWQLLGYDEDSKFENMYFKDFNDFYVYSRSYAIKHGISFDNITHEDYYGNDRIGKWDIGAVQHEYKKGLHFNNIKLNKVKCY